MIKDIEKVWPEWRIVEQIGKGSFGEVYKAVRTDHGLTSTAAIKVISIPQDEGEVNSLRSEGLDLNATRTYLQGIVDDFVSEIQLMESLKGMQNIVSVEDYKVVEHTDRLAWDIYIRMELLTPFDTWLCSHKMSERDVLQLGVDICTALELCEKKHIIHRDIKPGNIFINDFNFFKLGDFGIARKLEGTTGNLSKKGTYNYMAPEVAHGLEYDSRVDIYSLGIVLYRLLNGMRLPFLDSEQKLMDPNARKEALERRLRGEPLPKPKDASESAASLILCACAYDPNKRFRNATAMKKALQSVIASESAANSRMEEIKIDREAETEVLPLYKAKKEESQAAPRPTITQNEPVVENPPAPQKKKTKQKPKKAKKKIDAVKIILSVAVVLAIAGAASVLLLPSVIEDVTEDLPVIGGIVQEVSEGNERKKNITSILEQAKLYADVEEYKQALNEIDAGLEQYPDAEELTAKQQEYQTLLAEQTKQTVLRQAEQYAENGNYEMALKLIQDALEDNGGDADYLQRAATYTENFVTSTLAAAEQDGQRGDYASAYKTIQDALKIVGSNASLSVKLTTYEQSYVSSVIDQADELLAQKNYSGARSVLNEASSILPSNTALKEKLQQVSDWQPVSLASISVLNGGWEWNTTAPEDPFGNDYSGMVNYAVFKKYDNTEYSSSLYSGGYGNYAEYRLYGKYDSISMILAPYTSIGETESAWIQIYADDSLVFTSPRITRKTDAIQVEVPIADAEYIKIVVVLENNYGDTGALIMSNVQLWPAQV